MSVKVYQEDDKKGSTLTIENLNEGDAGNYTCQLGRNDEKTLTHTIEFEKKLATMVCFYPSSNRVTVRTDAMSASAPAEIW